MYNLIPTHRHADVPTIDARPAEEVQYHPVARRLLQESHTHVQVAGDSSSASFVETRQGFTKVFTELLQNALLYATL